MRRVLKVKLVSSGVLVRKAHTPAHSSSRRTFPAWIDASERGVAFPASGVTKRVRDGLVLRLVGRKETTVVARNSSDGSGAR